MKRFGRPAPAQLFYIGKQSRLRPQRGEILEQQRKLPIFPEHRRWKILERAMLVNERRRAYGANARDPGIAVSRVADEREKVGDAFGLDAELRPHTRGIPDLARPTQHLDDAIAPYALREVLVRGPNAHLLHGLISRARESPSPPASRRSCRPTSTAESRGGPARSGTSAALTRRSRSPRDPQARGPRPRSPGSTRASSAYPARAWQ